MKLEQLTLKYEKELEKRVGLSKLFFLICERDKLDQGIFSETGWKASEYKDLLLAMLEQKDIADNKLAEPFEGYKKDWNTSKIYLFESSEQLSSDKFIKEYKAYLSQDILDSIKLTKDVSLKDLKIEDSIGIFTLYYQLRFWLNKKINDLLEEHKLNDNQLLLLALNDKAKFEWKEDATKLVGLLEELQEKDWIHLPVSSSKEKAALIKRTFSFSKGDIKIGYIDKIFKTPTFDKSPFEKIEKNS